MHAHFLSNGPMHAHTDGQPETNMPCQLGRSWGHNEQTSTYFLNGDQGTDIEHEPSFSGRSLVTLRCRLTSAIPGRS